MRKLISMLLVLIVVSACAVTPGIRKLDKVPEALLDHIKKTEVMNVIEKDQKTLYLLLMTFRENAEATMNLEGNRLIVQVIESGQQNALAKPTVFQINRTKEMDEFGVYLNGEPAVLNFQAISP